VSDWKLGTWKAWGKAVQAQQNFQTQLAARSTAKPLKLDNQT